MRKILLLITIFSFLTIGHSFAQTLYIDDTASTLFPKSCDTGSALSLQFVVRYTGTFISNENIHINYRIKHSYYDSSAFLLSDTAALTPSDSATINVPSFRTNSSDAFFSGEDIVVIWPTGTGGIALTGDSIFDSVQVYNSSGISPLNDNVFSIDLYPNPAENLLYLNYNENAIHLEQVRICDLLGRTLLTKTSAFNTIVISSLPDGPYFMEAITSEETYCIRPFIKSQ